jgi:hypothetical protein
MNIRSPGPVTSQQRAPFRIVSIKAHRPLSEWPLSDTEVTIIGRHDPDQPPPEIDLWPDQQISRRHAQVWFEVGQWWIQDLGSKHGTFLAARKLGHAPARLEPWALIQAGESALILASDRFTRFREGGWIVDCEMAQHVSFSLVTCGVSVVKRLVVRTERDCPTTSVVLDIEGLGHTDRIGVPPLRAGESHEVDHKFHFVPDVLESQLECSSKDVVVSINDRAVSMPNLHCDLLAYNDWSRRVEDRAVLASFVSPNAPVITQVALDATSKLGTSDTHEAMLQGIYDLLHLGWNIVYRHEPPTPSVSQQRVRFADQVLVDPDTKVGQGTCIDIALIISGCLEYLGCQPLIAVCNHDGTGTDHALVGCWRKPRAALSTLEYDVDRLLDGGIWVDPNGVTRDPRYRGDFSSSRAIAFQFLRNQKLDFGLDICAARRFGIKPLPFAGTPRWSSGVASALRDAEVFAQRRRVRLGTVALLMGLLSDPKGLARLVLDACFEDVDAIVKQLEASVMAKPTLAPATGNYIKTLALARSEAKVAGSAVVVEYHMLRALLSLMGSSVLRALAELGVSSRELLSALQGIWPSGPGHRSSYSVFSEWRDRQPPA